MFMAWRGSMREVGKQLEILLEKRLACHASGREDQYVRSRSSTFVTCIIITHITLLARLDPIHHWIVSHTRTKRPGSTSAASHSHDLRLRSSTSDGNFSFFFHPRLYRYYHRLVSRFNLSLVVSGMGHHRVRPTSWVHRAASKWDKYSGTGGTCRYC